MTDPTEHDGTPQNDGKVDLLVTGGTGNYSYAWSDGSMGASITGLGVGPVAVYVDDGNSEWNSGYAPPTFMLGLSGTPGGVTTGTVTGTLI